MVTVGQQTKYKRNNWGRRKNRFKQPKLVWTGAARE